MTPPPQQRPDGDAPQRESPRADRPAPGAEARAKGILTPAQLAQAAADAARGDEDAFALLQSRLLPGLRRLFQDRVGRREDLIEDLSQRAMLGLWQALRTGRYDPAKSAITTFAYAVAHKVWLQHLRASGRADAALDRYTARLSQREGEAQSTSPEGVQEFATLLDALRKAITPGRDALDMEQNAQQNAQPQGTTSQRAAAPSADGDPRDGQRHGSGDGSDDNSGDAGLTAQEQWLVRSWAMGESDRALARKMGIAPSNVNARKQAVYAKLRAYLSRLGFAHGP